MSDMSLPSSLVPQTPDDSAPFAPAAPLSPAAAAALASTRPAVEPFAWPTPPTPGYPAPTCQTGPEPCEIEGLNGKISVGRLSFFDAEAGLVHLLMASARGTLTLKLTQFRRLTLTRPLPPLAPPAGAAFDATTPLLPHRTLVSVNLKFKDGQTSAHDSVGRVETPLGLFTFAPIDKTGNVLRSFYPRQCAG